MVLKKSLTALISILLFFCVTPQIAFSLAISMHPGTVDLGRVEGGEERVIDMYLLTDYGKELVVDMSFAYVPNDFYTPGRVREGLDFNPYNVSEEDTRNWLEFMENPVVLPTKEYSFWLPSGEYTIANKRASAILRVPADAEPGYHFGSILPTPRVSTVPGGGITIITRAKMTYFFRVPGEAIRSGYIAGFQSKREWNEEKINVIFKNNGTVTMKVRGPSLKVYGEGGEVIANLRTNSKSVPPGKIMNLASSWNVKDREPGTYKVSATVSWTTGNYSAEGEIEVHEYKPPEVKVKPEEMPIPYGIILPVVLIIGFMFYWFFWRREYG